MSDLIDREKAINTVNTMTERCTTKDMNDLHDLIIESLTMLPSVDAVPVVRCKDCRWSRGFATFACPMVGRINLKDDDFCSRGKRRADERSD